MECGHECLDECYDCPKHSTLRGRSKNKHPSLCNFSVGDIILPGCGHVFQNAKCWQNQTIVTLECMTPVTRKLPRCEHFKVLYVCNFFHLCSEFFFGDNIYLFLIFHIFSVLSL